MTKLPEPQHGLVALIDQWHESQQEPPRAHLGASVLGDPCDRKLWLGFHWAVIEKFPGRILRLFARGQDEEPRIVKDLRAVGLVIEHTGADQMRVELAPHIGGSLDGIIISGVPEAPKAKHVLECKTHNKRSFDDLEKLGVEKSKPQHFCQMQCYMHGTKIERALYVAVCKDDDRLHVERVRYDAAVALKAIARGSRIVYADRMPDPISTDGSWYQCKMCAAHDFCHASRLSKAVNCRTCALSTATDHGTWHCGRYDSDGIPVEYQRAGCECHVLHPDLVPWTRIASPSEFEAIYVIDGREVRNGEPCVNSFSSQEILGNVANGIAADTPF